MDDFLKKSLELDRDAVFASEDGVVRFRNGAAARLLPSVREGTPIDALLPPLLCACGESTAGFAEIDGRAFSVRAADFGPERCWFLQPLGNGGERGFLSDGALNQLRSALCDLQLASLALIGPGRELSGEREETAAILRRSCSRMLRQLSNLSTAVHLQDGTLPFFPQHEDVSALCRELIDAAADGLSGSGVALELSDGDRPVFANVDRELFSRLLLNLLANAYQHTPPGGRISVRLDASKTRLLLSVSDTGEGIPQELLGELFRRYAVPASERDLRPALTGGLGLSLCAGIARLHGGALVVESRPGVGTEVRVSFPQEQIGTLRFSDRSDFRDPPVSLIRVELSELLPLEAFGGRYSD